MSMRLIVVTPSEVSKGSFNASGNRLEVYATVRVARLLRSRACITEVRKGKLNRRQRFQKDSKAQNSGYLSK